MDMDILNGENQPFIGPFKKFMMKTQLFLVFYSLKFLTNSQVDDGDFWEMGALFTRDFLRFSS